VVGEKTGSVRDRFARTYSVVSRMVVDVMTFVLSFVLMYTRHFKTSIPCVEGATSTLELRQLVAMFLDPEGVTH
jgi:hypothetical protein